MLLHVDRNLTSPYALAAFVALRVKGVPFSVARVDLASGAQHAEAYVRQSVTHRVPTLVDDDGFALSESSAITEYLEERLPPPAHPPLYPEGARDRARARQIQAWIRSDLLPLRAERSTETLFLGAPVRPLGEAARRAADTLVAAALAWLPDGAPTLFERWSIADVDLAVVLARLVRNGDPVPASLAAYVARHWTHPAIAEWCAMDRDGATPLEP